MSWKWFEIPIYILGNQFLKSQNLLFFQKLPKRKNFQRVESAASNNLDYTQYDTDNDQNLIFYNDNPQQQGKYNIISYVRETKNYDLQL